MYTSMFRSTNTRLAALSAAVALSLSAGSALGINQSGEANNMQRVGHTDLQGRPAYQPNVIQYPNGRYIAFAGMHSGEPVPVPSCPSFLPNSLKPGSPCENNGTMIIDVTDPRHPVETALIPTTGTGQSQMVRVCLGSDLPSGPADKASNVYMMRNIGTGYEVWDVTNVNAPIKKSSLTGMRNTHKMWWECNTGVAYLPGSITSTGWRQRQSMVIVDWSDPVAAPTYLRTFGLPGGQPSGTGVVPPSLHGPISAHEHPHAANALARAATASDIIGNRVYAAYGVGDDGVMQILDRNKLLPPLSNGRGGAWAGNADDPSDVDLLSAQAGILHMSPDQGGHTAMPVFGLEPPSYAKFNEFAKRDIVLLASEATADTVDRHCDEAPHWSFIVDVTVENSKTVPPGTKLEHNEWQGPMVLSTMSVDERSGAKYPRGNYCGRGARFGVHSSEENFHNPMYGKLTALAYFNGGVRIWDIREPQAPVEVAFYVPEANANTDPAGYMTNNVEIDNRGYIYVVDRNGAGLDILQLMGPAANIVFPPGK